jgi:hypothetical protein
VAVGAAKSLAVLIDLFEESCNLFGLSAEDNAILLDLLYRKQLARTKGDACLFRP